MKKISFKTGEIVSEILTRDDLKHVVNEDALGSKKKHKCFYSCYIELSQGGFQVVNSWGSSCTTNTQCGPGSGAVLDACEATYPGSDSYGVTWSCDVYPG